MEDTKPTNGTSANGTTPQPQTVQLRVGTPEFAAYLAGFTEYHDARTHAKEARNLRLQVIGEIVEVAALKGIPLIPSEILAIAEAALQNPDLARDLAPATLVSVIINKPNGREQ